MSSGWSGISFGLSGGIGESVNLEAVTKGNSNSILLNTVKPTKDRGIVDRAFNYLNPVLSGTIDYLRKKL